MNKAEQEEKYRAKSGEAYLAAHNARSPDEKQAWLALARDWDKLADEVRDQLDARPIAQWDPAPQPTEAIRVFQPSDETE